MLYRAGGFSKMSRRLPTEPMDRFIALLWGGPPARPAMTVCLELNGKIDVSRMTRSLQLVLDAIPLFRCRFVEHWWKPYWEEQPGRTAEDMVVAKPYSDPERHLQDLLEEPLESGISVMIWQGPTDMIGLKFDHRFGDFRAFVEFVNVLGEVYTRLCDDGDYVFPSCTSFPRDIRQLTRSLSFRKRIELFRSFYRSTRSLKASGWWRLPTIPQRDGGFTYVHHTFNPQQVAQLEDYGYARGATPFQVLLAAYFIAMTETLPESDDVLTVLVPVDLRRFLPNPEPFRWCNLVGNELLFLHNAYPTSLDASVKEVRGQMVERRAQGMGLASPNVVLDILPGGIMEALVPFALRHWIRRIEIKQLAKSRLRKMLYASHGGEYDAGRLRFGEISVRHAFGCPGEIRIPGYNGFGMDSFAGTLTMWCGCGPRDEMRRVQRKMREVLSPLFSG
jgi:NRPS condensation-like uncharacterized protein